MLKSKDVLSYLEKNLIRKYYVSMFVTGSIPPALKPQTDLDIIIVIRNSFRNEFFENLKSITDKLIKSDKNVTYSFYRGPLKYEHKGLIHFIIYTDVKAKEENTAFKQTLLQMLTNFKKNAKIISGESIDQLTKDINFEDKNREDLGKKKINKHYDMFKKRNIINYQEWVKINNNWRLRRVWKKPSKFLSKHLDEYYKKQI